MLTLSRVALAALVAVVLFRSLAAADVPKHLIVSAGARDRLRTIVEVRVPAELTAGLWQLVSGEDRPLLQVDAEGRGRFSVEALLAGHERSYEIQSAAAVAENPGQMVSVGAPKAKPIRVKINGKEAFEYQGEKTPLPEGFAPEYRRGGYIYPVLTPAGKLIADDYPPNHKHHHGIWSPWTKTRFEGRDVDFWNMGDKKGTVEVVEYGHAFSGPVCGGFVAKHRMMDLTVNPPKPALNETWTVTAYSAGSHAIKPSFIFDLDIHQECATASPLILEQYRYGGLGFRGSRQWNGKDGCQFLTSEGKDRSNGNGTRARWCYVGAKVDGAQAGVTILGAPDDFRFPQPVRLHPDEPFFCFAPEQLGEFRITPDKPYDMRYRFIVSDGPPDTNQIERLWEDYAHPPTAQVK